MGRHGAEPRAIDAISVLARQPEHPTPLIY